MKRVVGRRMSTNQTLDYGAFKARVVNLDLLDVNAQLFRFRWASNLIDDLRKNHGSVQNHVLDVGTYDGTMAAIIAQKHMNPDDITSPTVDVEAIEAHKESYMAAEELAKAVRAKGYRMVVHNTTFEEFKTDTTYDTIVMFECLEHTCDPLFCIEKIYDMLEIGGHLFLTVPEEHGCFGVKDKNRFHYWVTTVQSLMAVIFYDDRKWHVKQCFEQDDLIHIAVQKMSYQA
jgi:2-polyprenyl-3-methyl-5-hydroxy-6-metoxy-1,4-benzoquinol methylase